MLFICTIHWRLFKGWLLLGLPTRPLSIPPSPSRNIRKNAALIGRGLAGVNNLLRKRFCLSFHFVVEFSWKTMFALVRQRENNIQPSHNMSILLSEKEIAVITTALESQKQEFVKVCESGDLVWNLRCKEEIEHINNLLARLT